MVALPAKQRIGMRRFCRQKNWKNRSANAMSKIGKFWAKWI